jgi:hypothetical protein
MVSTRRLQYKMKPIFIMQVRQVVQRRINLRKISFVAHSLGGLVTRYAIGKLYEPAMDETSSCDIDKPSDEQNVRDVGKIAGLEPINFITSATPHLGSRLNKQVSPWSLLSSMIYLLAFYLLGQTAQKPAHFLSLILTPECLNICSFINSCLWLCLSSITKRYRYDRN